VGGGGWGGEGVGLEIAAREKPKLTLFAPKE